MKFKLGYTVYPVETSIYRVSHPNCDKLRFGRRDELREWRDKLLEWRRDKRVLGDA